MNIAQIFSGNLMNLISGISSKYSDGLPVNSGKVSFGRQRDVYPKNLKRDVFQRSNNETGNNSTNVCVSGFRTINTTDRNYHYTHERYEYKNVLPVALKAEPNGSLYEELKDLEEKGIIHNSSKAEKRISSLSKYLKETMVGFVTPDGENWFEGACEYIIKGSAGFKIPENEYVKYAKQFWSLMVMADKYWLSEEFMDYLDGFDKPNAGVEATMTALKEIKQNQTISGREISFGYSSKLRYIDKILANGCAYSGERMSLKYADAANFPTMEHIFPHVSGGEDVDVDCNYLVVTGPENGLRSDIPLVMYLKGWDAGEYDQAFPKWKKIAKHELAKKEREGKPQKLGRADKKILNKLLFRLERTSSPDKIFDSVPERLRQRFNELIKENKAS